jgi:hypothetical protein
VTTIAELTGVSVPKRSAEQIVRDAAQDFDAFYQQLRRPTPDSGPLLVAAIDCKGIPMIKPPSSVPAAPRLTKSQKANRKRNGSGRGGLHPSTLRSHTRAGDREFVPHLQQGGVGKQEALRLRRIEKLLEDKQETIVFVTNHMGLAATTVAIYKDRWQIELFFKAIKQSLRIKTFIGTSENAVQTQIWTALIAMLVVRYLQLRSSWNWSLSHLVALLRQQLFVYRDLWSWLNQPFQPPATLDDGGGGQLSLGLGR